jgi:hypothetical protein
VAAADITRPPSSNGNAAGLDRAVSNYIERIFHDYPMDAELRRRREITIRSDAILFLSEFQGRSEEPRSQQEIEEILRREFCDPELLRDLYLRSETQIETYDKRCWVSIAGAALAALAAAVTMKAAAFQMMWSAPNTAFGVSTGVSALLLMVSPLTGIAGYMTHWILSRNRYRIAPFVLVSVLAFAVAGSTRIDLEILERAPIPRSHILISIAVPMLNLNLAPVIRRYIVDLDRSGLPQEFTRSRSFVSVQEEDPSALFYFFGLFTVVIGVGNYHVMNRMAEDLDLLGDPI